MEKCNANEISYDLMEVLGQKVIFTCLRVDRSTVPQKLYAYDIRHDDECQGEMTEIKPFVLINHWGTIITKNEIELIDNGCRFVNEKTDVRDCNHSCTLAEYIIKYCKRIK